MKRLAGLVLVIAALSGCGDQHKVRGATETAAKPAAGRVLWTADAERPAADEWASSRADPPGPAPCPYSAPPDLSQPGVKRVAAPVAQGRFAYAITTSHGDHCDGERAELGDGNPARAGFEDRLFHEGDERWISLQVRLAPNFDVHVNTWRVIVQFHQPGGQLGPPPLALQVTDGDFVLYKGDANVESGSTIPIWRAPARNDRWVRFTLHVKFSADPAVGFVEIYGNPAGGPVRLLLPRTPTYTMKKDASGVAVPLHARIGIYRNPDGGFGTETAFFDGFTVATSRAAAEANAFP
ncbi:MAG: hypothetical protein QOC77_1862 [Thermoleophilaceae bacterium]|nr:hypothetical protein [Thermoleophilaceae bacterium]